MIRMSKETDYGILLLTHFADTPEAGVFSARELASETGVPLPMVSKILKNLVRRGMLNSLRGAKGGYYLTRQPEEISIAEVIRALDGPLALTECIEHPGDCRQEPTCRVRKNWAILNRTVKTALEGITLAEMSQPLPERLVALQSGEARPT